MSEKTVSTKKVMSKSEAQALDAKIIEMTNTSREDWYRNVAPIMAQIRESDGYLALGYSTFKEYCQNLDERFAHPMEIKRAVERLDVEAAVGAELPAQHAYALARLPNAEAQQEVFEWAKAEFGGRPVERNYLTLIDRWFRKHQTAKRTSRQEAESEGWSDRELEDDPELAKALNRIGEVYGRVDRTAIQNGTIVLSRKDIIGLAAFHVTRMKELRYLITANHWDLARAIKFLNAKPDADTTLHELQNFCLGTAGLYYTCSVEGFDITIRACKAVTAKIQG